MSKCYDIEGTEISEIDIEINLLKDKIYQRERKLQYDINDYKKNMLYYLDSRNDFKNKYDSLKETFWFLFWFSVIVISGLVSTIGWMYAEHYK